MEFVLLYLKAPSNIEKHVRRLKTSLYSGGGFLSAQALPVMIPLCFIPPRSTCLKPAELQAALRRAVGKQAPFLQTGSVVEYDGSLFWDLEPKEQLRCLHINCRQEFSSSDSPQSVHRGREPDPLPTGRGFFLCSLEGQPGAQLPTLTVPQTLSFPAKTAILLSIRRLIPDREGREQDTPTSEAGPWWQSLVWEELVRIPLRKSG